MSVAATMSRSSSSMTGTNFSRTTNARAVTGTAKASPNPTALSRRRPRPAGRRPSGRRSANPDHQGVGEDADAQRDVLADRVAVDLRLDGSARGHGELAAAEAVEPAVTGAVPRHDVGDDGDPAEGALGRDDDGDADATAEDLAQRAEDVGDPADGGLDLLVGAGHDLAVEAEAGHDEEDLLVVVDLRPAVVRAVALARLDRLVGDTHEAHVDPAVGATEHRLDGVLEGVDGQAEVAREEVARAAGEQTEGDVGADERRGDRADGAVTAERGDDVGAGTHRFAALLLAGLLLGRLDPRRVLPAVPGRGLGHELLRCDEVVDLDRVVDDGEAATSAGRVGHGGDPRARGVRGRPSSGA